MVLLVAVVKMSMNNDENKQTALHNQTCHF